jgi:hypothetical protein
MKKHFNRRTLKWIVLTGIRWCVITAALYALSLLFSRNTAEEA